MAKTSDQVIAEFHRAGISIAEWAREHGFDRSLVYSVIKGRRAIRGQSHDIAVRLGIKTGRIRKLSKASDTAARQ